MPTQTFFNLPKEKRQAIIKIAIEEFANHDYSNASISRVVAQAKIAKGSFYQYFQDKQELYLYLVELATQERISFLRGTEPPELKQGFFPYLRWLMGAGARFNLAHPSLSRVVNRALYGDLPFRDEAIKQTREISWNYIQELVQQGMKQGDINPDIDPDLAAFTINTLGNELGNFILHRIGVTPEQLVQDELNLDMRSVEQVFDELIQVLEHGLNNRLNGQKGLSRRTTSRSR